MAGTNPNFMANGNISPCRFVTPASAADNRVTQCAAETDQIAGISGSATETPPLPGNATYAATSGNLIRVHGQGEQCLLQYGATVTRGDYLCSDANGKGIPVPKTVGGKQYGAVALQSGSADDIRNVQVNLGKGAASIS